MLDPDGQKTDLVNLKSFLEVFNVMLVHQENHTKSVEAGFHVEGL